MKIILEDMKSEETEVIIRGNLADRKVQHLLSLLKESNLSSKFIVFDENTEILTDIAEVYYFEVTDRKLFAVCAEKAYLCKHTLAEILTLFKNQGIVQIGKSLLVNVHHVKSLEAEFSGNYVVNLDNGARLLASRFYMKTFRNAIMEV